MFQKYITVKLPDLLELSKPESECMNNDERFKLLSWILFGTDDFASKLQNIPRQYVLTVSLLMFLLHVSSRCNLL